ncbi:hypothetical protein QWY90_04270 [Flavobacterium paronense]|uniref:Uncharacterized protein n=1 Tax=Flavobacterium paronense TaxID=1392775 RepID=A0ABV5GHF8_9FLAO|nr:hypothetical protein [Flavobacterium paronense]MDN3676521.1 hypothetical protein [Flavobacterium paronense]
MIKYNYLIPLSLLSSSIQTVLYALVLWFAYTYYTVPNAGLIIGTIAPILVVLFFVIVLVQNLILLSAKNDDAGGVFILLGVLLVLPFILSFTWLSPVIVLFHVMLLYIPFYLRKQFLSRIRK